MIPVFTVEQMRSLDRYTIETRGVAGTELMRRAAAAVFGCLQKRVPAGGRVLVACGAGNNGGDGYALAALLHAAGFRTAVLPLPGMKSADCAHYASSLSPGVEIVEAIGDGYDCLVDAMLGTGLTREVAGAYRDAIEAFNAAQAPLKLAVDIPSGVDGNTGTVRGVAARADRTVTFAGYKFGLLLADGRDTAGEIEVADIGIQNVAPDRAFVWEKSDAARCFPKRLRNTHKGSYGRCCVIAGSRTYFGAAALSSLSALRAGAGYCYLACPESLAPYYRTMLPEVLVRELPERDGALRFDEAGMLRALEGCDSVAFGMGLGTSEDVALALRYVLERAALPLLIDADGLNSLALGGADALRHTACRVVLTPHPGEFSRLLGRGYSAEQSVGEAVSFAKRYGVTLLLKGATSIVTDGTRVACNVTGTPALAKGGSGDVLSGILGALLARNVAPFEAACAASFVLGKAGEAAAQELSEYAPLARDVSDRIGKAIRDIVT